MKIPAAAFSSHLPNVLRPGETLVATWNAWGPLTEGLETKFSSRKVPPGALVLTRERLFMLPAAKWTALNREPVHYEFPCSPSFEAALSSVSSVEVVSVPLADRNLWSFLRIRWVSASGLVGSSGFSLTGSMELSQRAAATESLKGTIQRLLPRQPEAAGPPTWVAARPATLASPVPTTIVKETIREVVKVPCRYCQQLNLMNSAKCFSCGAPLG